jgi:hypothetical protein
MYSLRIISNVWLKVEEKVVIRDAIHIALANNFPVPIEKVYVYTLFGFS